MTTVARNRESSSKTATAEDKSSDSSRPPAGPVALDEAMVEGDGQAASAELSTEDSPPTALPEALIEDLGNIFKLLADETRLRILFYLTRRGELHVRALCDLLGQSQPAVSHHLAMLRTAGMIEPRRDGKHNFYRVLPEAFEHLVDLVFESIPHSEDRIRFESYELSFRRPSQPR